MSSLYKDLLKILLLVWKGLVQVFLIILIMGLIPNLNLYTIILTVLSVTLSFKLFSEKPRPKDWAVTSFKIALLVTTFYIALNWLGSFGIIGIIIILLGFAAYRIYSNWKLYDSLTTWGAKRVMGKTKENFNLEEALKDEREIKKRDSGEDGLDNNTRKETSGTKQSFAFDTVESVLQPTLQALQEQRVDKQPERQADEQGDALQGLQPKIRERARKTKIKNLKVMNDGLE